MTGVQPSSQLNELYVSNLFIAGINMHFISKLHIITEWLISDHPVKEQGVSEEVLTVNFGIYYDPRPTV